jgi:hypothetical protein
MSDLLPETLAKIEAGIADFKADRIFDDYDAWVKAGKPKGINPEFPVRQITEHEQLALHKETPPPMVRIKLNRACANCGRKTCCQQTLRAPTPGQVLSFRCAWCHSTNSVAAVEKE